MHKASSLNIAAELAGSYFFMHKFVNLVCCWKTLIILLTSKFPKHLYYTIIVMANVGVDR